MKELNPKQALFVKEYMRDFNATQAYIRAGYSLKGAEASASRLLANAKVRARVDIEMAKASARTSVTPDRVIRELARIAFVNPACVIDFDTGEVSGFASEDDLAAVSGVKVKITPLGEGEKMVEREVKLHDKQKALEALAKNLGMLTGDLPLTLELPRIIDDIREGAGGAGDV